MEDQKTIVVDSARHENSVAVPSSVSVSPVCVGVNTLKVGDVVVLKHKAPPRKRDVYSSSIINNYAVVTHVPENTTFVYGRFVIGHSSTKIKSKSINWEYTIRVSEIDKQKYKDIMRKWNLLK